jgi:hypothetical protein
MVGMRENLGLYEILNELPHVHILNQSKWFLYKCGEGIQHNGLPFALHIRNKYIVMGWSKGQSDGGKNCMRSRSTSYDTNVVAEILVVVI